jgi:hypothetical protein
MRHVMSGRCHIAEEPELHKHRSKNLISRICCIVCVPTIKYLARNVFFCGTTLCLLDTIGCICRSFEGLLLMHKRMNAVTS